VNETAPVGPNSTPPGARQSKTADLAGLIRSAAAAAGVLRRPHPRNPRLVFQNTQAKGENDMMTSSSARKVLLGVAIAASMGIGYAIGAQPHMTASIGLLQNARAELGAANPNKGGHRERAMGLIDQAIGEVRAGIAFAGG